MISSFYAAVLALLIVYLSLRVIKLRRANQVKLGDGGVPELEGAIRAQGNATEYVPISLILLVLLELDGANLAFIHVGGIALIMGRLIHAKGLLTDNLPYRILGMQFTLFTIITLALLNIVYAGMKAFGG
jgi:hypothetical protein